MPTKASEYMISGTPILVYSHSETAVSRFFNSNECGCCVSEHDQEKLIDAITLLLTNQKYRNRISKNAVRLAAELFDADKVRTKFRDLLYKTANADK